MSNVANRFYQLAILPKQTPAQQKEFAMLCAQFTPQQLASLAQTALNRASQSSN